MTKSIVAFTACAVLTIATAHAQRGGPALVDWRVPFESKIAKGIPYSAELVSENVQLLTDGNRIVQRTTGRVYRDSEGRVRREENRTSGSPSISISDVVARTSFSLNTERHEALQTAMPFIVALAADQVRFFVGAAGSPTSVEEAEAKKLDLARSTQGRGGRGPLTPDVARQLERESEKLAVVRGLLGNGREESVEEKLQDRFIGGVLAVGTRRTTTIAAGAIGNEQPIKIVSEEWYSPELQVLVMTQHADPRTGRSTYQLSDINRNEPDPTLFQIPPDYTIRKGGLK